MKIGGIINKIGIIRTKCISLKSIKKINKKDIIIKIMNKNKKMGIIGLKILKYVLLIKVFPAPAITSEKSAPSRLASLKVVPRISAPRKFASLKSCPAKDFPRKSCPE